MKRADFLRLMARLPEGLVMDLCAKAVEKCAPEVFNGEGEQIHVAGNNVVCLPWVIPVTVRRRSDSESLCYLSPAGASWRGFSYSPGKLIQSGRKVSSVRSRTS
jgi:hypothetical protein